MTKRRVLWLVAVIGVSAGLAVLIPGSPVYLPKLYSSNHQYDGHSLHYWIEALDDPDVQLRTQAIHTLGAHGAEAGEATPALAAILLGDTNREVRIEAALALSKMSPASRPAVPALGQALQDPELLVRLYATLALFHLRGEARPAVPALIQALGDERNQEIVGRFGFSIREKMAETLGRASAGSAEAVPVLMEILEGDGTEALRRSAARALGDVGAEARPATPQLRKLLTSSSTPMREDAAEALQKIEG
jgi:HEAT repeat protein